MRISASKAFCQRHHPPPDTQHAQSAASPPLARTNATRGSLAQRFGDLRIQPLAEKEVWAFVEPLGAQLLIQMPGLALPPGNCTDLPPPAAL